MAERIQVELVDDIDGSVAQQTVTFALDGVAYEIDLSEQHAQQLRGVFAQYIEHARKPERSSRQTKRQEREERQAKQTNRQLTEQIRGAAQRTRERLKEQEDAAAAPGRTQDELDVESTPESGQIGSHKMGSEDAVSESAAVESPSEVADEERQSSSVSLPQFSAAVD